MIIVADGAVPKVHEIVAKLNIEAAVLRTEGEGRSAARNLGAMAASGEILVFLDDDILVGPDFLESHLRAQTESPALVHGRLLELIGLIRVDDPRDGGPGCPPIKLQDLEAGNWRPDGCRTTANALERAAESYFQGRLDVDAPWLAGAGANLSLPKGYWEAVDGFDEAFGLRWGMEDLDLAFRLHQSGHGIRYDNSPIGYHMSHHNPDRWEDHKINLELFARRAATPEATALAHLLAPDGSPERYEQAVHQIRAEGVSPLPQA